MKNVFGLLFLFVSFSVAAQISYVERLEFDMRNGRENEQVFEFDKNGFILYSRNDDISTAGRWYHFSLFNSKLELVETDSVLIDGRISDEQTTISNGNLYCFLKDKAGNFTLLTVTCDDLTIARTDGILPKKMYISEMAVLGDYAYFKSTIKRTPYLFSINTKSGKHEPIPLNIKNVKAKEISLVDFQLLEDSEEILLYASARIDKKTSDTYVICLDKYGKKTDIYNLSADISENIVDVSSCNTGNGNYIFTGTYSSRNSFYSEGIFFCKANFGKIEFIRFYPFADLHNFLSYLPERQQARIEKKKKRKEAAGTDFNLSYNIAAHDIIVRNDGYLLLGEAFYPTYRTETRTTTTTTNGVTSTTTTTVSVFDGYQYTHAVLAKFGLDGELLWDQTFEMWPGYKPYFVKRFIAVSVEDDFTVKMVFTNSLGIVSKIVDNQGAVIQNFQYDKIETSFENDKTKSSFSNIDYWYDNFFIAYGFQRIKNDEKSDVKRKRNVFFVSKVRFD